MNKTLIFEPMTAFTDLLICILAVYFARELQAWHSIRLMNTHWHWSGAFWMLALGGLLGAVSHGVGPHLSPAVKALIWKVTTISVGITSFFMVMAAFHHVFPFPTVRWLRWIPILLLAGYLVIITRDDRFINVVRFYVPGMVFILAVMLYSQFGLGTSGAGWISLGIIVSFIAAGVQVSGFDLHKHFNHNDIYHVIQMVGIYFIYHGAMAIRDF